MQSEVGKLFIGGISWDTNEERLREYFSRYGEILEAVIMKDRNTGRARGFGFVVFAESSVADRVIKQKHTIDGRLVEAKRAVPRDDPSTMSRSSGSIQGSPGPGRTRKIFVGGLPSTVTESEFKMYFEQFGAITDVVVMYDQNTQRPRGFGFITYDSEDSVDQVLLKTFHELNGKMVEVKRAVPKELSPSPSRSPFGGYNYGLSKISNLLNGYGQGYTQSTEGPYGLKMDARVGPRTDVRSGFSPAGSGYGLGLNFEPELIPGFVGSANFNPTPSHGQGLNLNPQFTGNPNRFSNAVGYDGGNGGSTSFFSSGNQNFLGNLGFNYGTNSLNSNAYIGSGGERIGGSFANAGTNWASPPFSSHGGGSISNRGGNIGYGVNDSNSLGLGGRGYARNTASRVPSLSSHNASNSAYEETFAGFYGGSSVYEDPAWRSADPEREGSGSFGFALGKELSDVPAISSPGYVGAYKSQINRGIVG